MPQAHAVAASFSLPKGEAGALHDDSEE